MKKSFLFICTILIFINVNAQNNVDSLNNIVTNNSDTTAVNAYYELGKIKYKEGQMDSARTLLLKGDSLGTTLDYTNGQIKIWRVIGTLEAAEGNFDKSKEWLGKGLALIDALKLPVMNKVDYLINLGVTHYYNKDVAGAIKYYLEATQLCRENNFDAKRSMLLNNLGIFFRSLERYEEALKIYDEALSLKITAGDSIGIGNVYYNKATAYSFLEDYEKTVENAQLAKDIYQAIESKRDVQSVDLLMGSALESLGKHEEAFENLKPFLQLDKLPFPLDQQFSFHLIMTKIYILKNEFSKAKHHLDLIEKDLMSTDFTEQQLIFLGLKAKVSGHYKDYISANKALNILIEKSKVHNSARSTKILKELETQYLTKEKDYEIELLNSQNEIANIKLDKSRQRNFGLTIGLGILALISFLLYALYKKIQIKNVIISEANEEKEILLKEIHHRVKNNLQVISALLSLQSKYISDESALDALREGHDRVESMALIHKNLYQHDNLKGVNTKDYLEKLIDSLFDSYNINEESINLKTDIQSIWLDVDTMIPLGLMVNELISNALKYGFQNNPKGELSISLKEKNERLVLKIKDNGKGVSEEDIRSSKSFGYSLLESFSRKLDAEIGYESTSGLEVTLHIKEYQKTA